MQIEYHPIIVVSVCAIFFYRAGRHERSWSILWADGLGRAKPVTEAFAPDQARSK